MESMVTDVLFAPTHNVLFALSTYQCAHPARTAMESVALAVQLAPTADVSNALPTKTSALPVPKDMESITVDALSVRTLNV